jgi:hypothetical protein
MFQDPAPQIDIVMQPIHHLNDTQDTSTQHAPDSDTPSVGVFEASIKMHYTTQHADLNDPTSGTTTPTSDRSSLSNVSSASSVSSSSVPKRSSMKSSLKSRQSTISIKSAPPSVRFAEPELPVRPRPTPGQQHRQQIQTQRNSVPHPLVQHRQRPASTVSSSASSRYSAGPQRNPTLPPHGVPTPHLGQINFSKPRASQRFSASVQPLRPGLRHSQAKVPENFTPPSLALERRVSSFQSVSSSLSTQSAPAALHIPASTGPPGQYNPREHYLPCLDAACTNHYSSAHFGLAYYLPQGPYQLSKHHGYCEHHGTKELKEANAWCKRNWESLRQNAGRKTLGQIAAEFDIFLETYRQERKIQNEELQQRQKHVVLGPSSPCPATHLKDKPIKTEWLWHLTPRHCTRSACSSQPYSPFSNHLFPYYHPQTPTSSFLPLPTLCPPCAKDEIDAFERMITEKWNSRCGWHGKEWDEWIGKVVVERFEGRCFWERAQEREVRERGVSHIERDLKEDGKSGIEKMGKVERKKSVLKRFFGKSG